MHGKRNAIAWRDRIKRDRVGSTPKGSYSPRGRSRHHLRTLLRTLSHCKSHSRLLLRTLLRTLPQNLSAPNHKSQIASDLKSRSPNRKNFPQIAVSGGSNRTFKSRDLWFEALFKSPLESRCRFPVQVVRTMGFSEKVHSVSKVSYYM